MKTTFVSQCHRWCTTLYLGLGKKCLIVKCFILFIEPTVSFTLMLIAKTLHVSCCTTLLFVLRVDENIM